MEFKLNRLVVKTLQVLIIGLFFMSCSAYKKPVSLNEAANGSEQGYVKVTYQNGDQDVFEKLEKNDGVVYGINSKKDDTPKTELKPDEVTQVEQEKGKASSKNTVLGIAFVVIVAGLLALMF